MKRHPATKAVGHSRGMALVLVLWIVAALSIFASSLGRMVRQEAAVIGVTRNMAEGRAMGEAAIYQLLQQMVLKPAEFSQYQVVQLPWAGRIIEVEVVPWSGLVDINAASQPLLSTLISRLGGGAGEGIAQALVDARQEARQAAASGFAWESPEDLLQIPGMNYGIYARLKPFVVADIDGRPGVNANAAAPALRQLLDGSTGQDSTNSTRYRLTARTVFDGQGAVMVMRDVDIGGGSQGALPWTLLSAAQVWAGRV